MARIVLTDDDMHDLRDERSFNAMADDGSEHNLYGWEFTGAELDKLARGGTIETTINGVEVELTR